MSEQGENNSQHLKSFNINFTILIGFAATSHLCLMFAPDVVSNKSDRASLNMILSAVEYFYEVLLVVAIFMTIRYVRRKEMFHRVQTVFWPTRCRHCARVLGRARIFGDDESGDRESCHGNSEDADLTELPDLASNSIQEASKYAKPTFSRGGSNRGQSDDSRNVANSERTADSGRPPNSVPVPQCSMSSFGGNNEVPQCGGRLHHQNRAMINVLNVFYFVCCVGLCTEVTLDFMCYFRGQYAVGTVIANFAYNLGLIIAVPTLVIYLDTYIGAVFVDSYQNLVTVALILLVSIWQCEIRLIIPIGSLLRVHNNVNRTICNLNNTIEDFLRGIYHIASPFYTESAIMLLGIALQSWNSIVSKTSIDLAKHKNPEEMEACTSNLCFQRRKKRITFKWKRSLRRITSLCRRHEMENHERRLLIPANSSERFSQVLIITWILFIVANLPYLGLSLYIVFNPTEISDAYEENFVLWSFEIAFSLLFCALSAYRNIQEMNIARRLGRMNDRSVRKLKGHEIMLLVCCFGIFCHCVFLLLSAGGILINNHEDRTAEHTLSKLCILAIVHAVVRMIMVWQMTVFLIGLPRRTFDTPFAHAEKKWVLIRLISVIVISGTQWLITSMANSSIIVLQRIFFGKVAGEVVGDILEPFGTLYGLHAAMMAYELYRSI